MSASACNASLFEGASSSTDWYSVTASRSLFFSRLLRARSRCLLMSCAMGDGAFLGFCGLAGEVRPRALPRHRHGPRFFRAGRTSTIYRTPSCPQNEFSPACSEAPQKTAISMGGRSRVHNVGYPAEGSHLRTKPRQTYARAPTRACVGNSFTFSRMDFNDNPLRTRPANPRKIKGIVSARNAKMEKLVAVVFST